MKKVKAQNAQKDLLDPTKEYEEFNIKKAGKHKNGSGNTKKYTNKNQRDFKYQSIMYEPNRCHHMGETV